MRSLLIVGVVLVSGCSTFESSRYEHRSTPEETVVVASGRAAEEAARSSTVYNCPSCGSESSGSPGSPNPSRTQSVADDVVERAVEDAGWAISRGISQKIYEVFE